MLGFVEATLDEIQEGFDRLPFEPTTNAFRRKVDSRGLPARAIIGARVRPGDSEQSVAEWIAESMIGADTVIEDLRQRRILGAARQRIDRDDVEQFKATPGQVFFRLEGLDQLVPPGAFIEIANPVHRAGAGRPLEMFLLVKTR